MQQKFKTKKIFIREVNLFCEILSTFRLGKQRGSREFKTHYCPQEHTLSLYHVRKKIVLTKKTYCGSI